MRRGDHSRTSIIGTLGTSPEKAPTDR